MKCFEGVRWLNSSFNSVLQTWAYTTSDSHDGMQAASICVSHKLESILVIERTVYRLQIGYHPLVAIYQPPPPPLPPLYVTPSPVHLAPPRGSYPAPDLWWRVLFARNSSHGGGKLPLPVRHVQMGGAGVGGGVSGRGYYGRRNAVTGGAPIKRQSRQPAKVAASGSLDRCSVHAKEAPVHVSDARVYGRLWCDVSGRWRSQADDVSTREREVLARLCSDGRQHASWVGGRCLFHRRLHKGECWIIG